MSSLTPLILVLVILFQVCSIIELLLASIYLSSPAGMNNKYSSSIHRYINEIFKHPTLHKEKTLSSFEDAAAESDDDSNIHPKVLSPTSSSSWIHFEDRNSFFVIAAIFNPASFRSRYNLYHKFTKHMNDTGAQLVTIECIFPSLNQHEFQVTDPNNPYHIQLKSKSVFWVKENLINIAVSRLPSHAKWVCWLDADIAFEDQNWIRLTINELKKYTIVQMFEKAKFLGPAPKNELLRIDLSFGYSVVQNQLIYPGKYSECFQHSGYGWAISVKDFIEINGLPDYDIVGSNDRFFAYSLLNRTDKIIPRDFPPTFKKLIFGTADRTFQILERLSNLNSKPIVGYVPVTISHDWHGSRKDRQYKSRAEILKNNSYNYFTDVHRNADGLYQLNPNKPALQRNLIHYFQMRHEDTTVKDLHSDSMKCSVLSFPTL